MELNKNSKWIKFYLKFNNNRPTNFCDYFWGSLKSILITLFTLVFALLIIISCLLSPIILFWKEFNEKSNLGSFQIFGMLMWFVIIALFIIYKIVDYYNTKNYKYKPYKKSIIKIWYEDFKNKHCTLITWK